MSENEVKVYELRDLCSKDIFPMFKIISKVGVSEFKTCFESDDVRKAITGLSGDAKTEDENVAAVGVMVAFEIADVVITHIPDCEKDIYKFLAGLSGIPEKQIAELPMNTFLEMIIDVIKKDEFKGFIKVVSKLFE